MRAVQGYSVPHRRLTRCEGPHSAPGFSGVSLGRVESRPARILAFLAQAHNPRRLVQRHDDADVGSCACPYTALLDGMPSRTLRDRLFPPLCGLIVSRYRRGDAFTSTPEGQELHLYEDEVVEDRLISAPYPPLSLRDGSFRETDRISTALFGWERPVSRGGVLLLLRPCPLVDHPTPCPCSRLYLITSSAKTRSVGGIVVPSAWAVFRLRTSSNFVGCSTGRSAGLVPFRILST
jgi:hypothetical protein